MSKAWERVAAVASDRFLAEGFAAVSLRTLGADLGMKPASLYHHCPGGKAELFVRSVSWRLSQVEATVRAAGDPHNHLEPRLRAMGEALLDAPLVDLQRLLSADIKRLSRQADRDAISNVAHEALLRPFHDAALAEQAAGRLREDVSPGVVAAAAVAVVTNLGQLHLAIAGPSARPQVSETVGQALALLARGAAR